MAPPTGPNTNYDAIPSDDGELEITPYLGAAHVWRRRFFVLFFTSISAVLLLVGGLLHKARWPRTYVCPVPDDETPFSYVTRNLTSDFDSSRFMGKPRLELDQAWHELLEGTMIRLSDEELLRANDSSDAVRHNEGGYVGGLMVSHSLHCLKRIKQYLYPEYYYTTEDLKDWDGLTEHVDHCLESLRAAVLCNIDPTVYTFRWTAHSGVKPDVYIPQRSVCVDWDGVHDWMAARAATADQVIGPPDNLLSSKEAE